MEGIIAFAGAIGGIVALGLVLFLLIKFKVNKNIPSIISHVISLVKLFADWFIKDPEQKKKFMDVLDTIAYAWLKVESSKASIEKTMKEKDLNPDNPEQYAEYLETEAVKIMKEVALTKGVEIDSLTEALARQAFRFVCTFLKSGKEKEEPTVTYLPVTEFQGVEDKTGAFHTGE